MYPQLSVSVMEKGAGVAEGDVLYAVSRAAGETGRQGQEQSAALLPAEYLFSTKQTVLYLLKLN